MKRILSGLVTVWLALNPGVVQAESVQADFETLLFGLPVGRLILAENSNGSAYAAKAEFRTTGVAGLLSRIRFTMSARGVGSGLDRRPRSYSESMDTGYRTSTGSVSFNGRDTRIDPLTALLAGVFDRSAETGCAFDRETFDGTRGMRLHLRPKASTETGLTCTGTLTRLSGYTEEQLDRGVSFSITVRFAQQGTKLVTQRADIQTTHGTVALRRQ